MRWTPLSEQKQTYCAAHNYKCDLLEHPGDPMVLDIAPSLVPGAWICPDAVDEIADQREQAREYAKENERQASGVVIPKKHEEIIYEALVLDNRDRLAHTVNKQGVKALTDNEIEMAMHCVEEHQDRLDEGSDDTFELLMEILE